MSKGLVAKQSVKIKADTSKVWEALTKPEMIKQYLFGTDTVSDWKVGSRITYKGVWEGKEYEDGGTITRLEPGKIFQSTYWSSMAGIEDIPENYATVTYELAREGEHTVLTVTQDNCKSKESQEHSEKNWGMVLQSLKKLVEK